MTLWVCVPRGPRSWCVGLWPGRVGVHRACEYITTSVAVVNRNFARPSTVRVKIWNRRGTRHGVIRRGSSSLFSPR
eukprot:3865865-Prymnesium_polylepis.1